MRKEMLQPHQAIDPGRPTERQLQSQWLLMPHAERSALQHESWRTTSCFRLVFR
jgi:hypothetical protein